MNPYIIVAVMIVIDIVSIPFAIRAILKKNIRHKPVIIAVLLAVFVAFEAAFSVLYINANQFYDRDGKAYASEEEVVYFNREGKEFFLRQTKADRWHFISSDGKLMYISERVYLDSDGYIVYDRNNEFSQTDRKFVYTDGDGNEYFLAQEIKWNHKGELKPRNKD